MMPYITWNHGQIVWLSRIDDVRISTTEYNVTSIDKGRLNKTNDDHKVYQEMKQFVYIYE